MGALLFFLAVAEKLAVVAGAAGLWVAYSSYRDQRLRDKASILAEQISFFRREVIDRVIKFERYQKENGRLLLGSNPDDMEVVGVAINVDGNNFKPNQENSIAHQNETNKAYEAKVFQTEIINVLEEFAIKVISAGGEESEYLKSIRHAFVHAVDRCAVWLMEQRKQLTKNDSFSCTLRLYKKWEQSVAR